MKKELKQALFNHLEELKHQRGIYVIKEIFERRLKNVSLEEDRDKELLEWHLKELKRQQEIIKDLRSSIDAYEYEQGLIADFLFPIITEQQEEAEEAYDERREEEDEEDNK